MIGTILKKAFGFRWTMPNCVDVIDDKQKNCTSKVEDKMWTVCRINGVYNEYSNKETFFDKP